MALTRRSFLRATGLGLAALALPLQPARRALGAGAERVLVVVFLRGGADGLTLVAPYGDPEYYALRPMLAVAPSDLQPLTGLFGLHERLPELGQLYASRELGVIHCVGSPDPTRSHFDAQDFLERAAPGDRSASEGWLNRTLALLGQQQPLAGVSLGIEREASLEGSAPSLALSSLDEFSLTGSYSPERRIALESLYAGGPLKYLSGRVRDTLAVVDTIASIPRATPVAYPSTTFGQQLRDVAALIRADVGVRVAALSLPGWDHHDRLRASIDPLMRDLSRSLAAFHLDLGTASSRVLTLVMTEFGRTVEENGTWGADHGRASVMLALGGGVVGGRVLLKNGRWPGLTPAASGPRRDLDVTTDFRDVFAEVLVRHLGVSDPSPVLPGHAWSPAAHPGLYG